MRGLLKYLHVIFLSVAIAAFSGSVMLHAQSDLLDISSPITLNTFSTDNSNVKIGISTEDNVFVIWQGVIEGKSHILLREKIGNSWTEPIVIDDDDTGDDYDPCLYNDSAGNPHIVWVSRNAQNQEIHYAHRLRGEWIYEPPIRTSSDMNLEFPALIVNPDGSPCIAWQEGKGINYSIWCALETERGEMVIYPISDPAHQSYNIYPQIFPAPISPILTWYQAMDEGFSLRSSVFVKDVKRWVEYPLDGMELLAQNRLPILYKNEKGAFSALWYDTIDGADHIVLGRQDKVTQCSGIIVDDGTTLNNSLPSASIDKDGEVFVCWKADLQNLVSQIFLARVYENIPSKSILVTDGYEKYYVNPEVDIDKNGIAHIVWYSSSADGGDGSVYYVIVKF